jgi:hypothetical protein
MFGIELKSGINDCYYNCERKCVNKHITRKTTNMPCDWDSVQNCTFVEYPNLLHTTATKNIGTYVNEL